MIESSREPENPGELRLVKDDRVVVLRSKQYEHGWWYGRAVDGSGREGLFPKNYVRKLNGTAPPPPPRPMPAIIDDDARTRPLSVRNPRKAEDHSFVFESLEAFDSLLATGSDVTCFCVVCLLCLQTNERVTVCRVFNRDR
jgi:hypothetical protein